MRLDSTRITRGGLVSCWWVMAKRKKDPDYSSYEDSASDFEPPAPTKRPAVSSRRKRRSTAAAAAATRPSTDEASTSALDTYATPHSPSRHLISSPDPMRASLLGWYAGVHEVRGMPWRKPFDPSLDADARAQRAYEVRSCMSHFVSVLWVGCSNRFFFSAEGLDFGDHASADTSRHGDSLL